MADSVCGYIYRCVFVCVCTICVLTFEILYLVTSCLVCRYLFRIPRLDLCVKVIELRSRSQEHKNGIYRHNLVAVDWNAVWFIWWSPTCSELGPTSMLLMSGSASSNEVIKATSASEACVDNWSQSTAEFRCPFACRRWVARYSATNKHVVRSSVQ